MSERVDNDISGHVHELCERFGVRYEDAARIEITPRAIRFTLFERNENGQKYIDLAGYVAQTERNFEVTT